MHHVSRGLAGHGDRYKTFLDDRRHRKHVDLEAVALTREPRPAVVEAPEGMVAFHPLQLSHRVLSMVTNLASETENTVELFLEASNRFGYRHSFNRCLCIRVLIEADLDTPRAVTR